VDEVFQAAATDAERLALSNLLGIATIPLTSFGVSTCCMVAQLIPPDLRFAIKPHTVQDRAAPCASLQASERSGARQARTNTRPK
jgi:hypothetical protein